MKLQVVSELSRPVDAVIFLPFKTPKGGKKGDGIPKASHFPTLTQKEWEGTTESVWACGKTHVYKAAPTDMTNGDPRDALRETLGKGLKALAGRSVKTVAILLPDLDEDLCYSLFEVPVLMTYDSAPYKTKKDDQKLFSINEVWFCGVTQTKLPRFSDLCRTALIIAESVNFSRQLSNEPANRLCPADFARKASSLRKLGVKVRNLPAATLKKMGGVQAVSAGSNHPPHFVTMELNPGKQRPVVLVGKGVTFDSGGLSIKPAEGMADMKNDMGGGAAVLGAMMALARLGCKRRVIGLIPMVENMPDGKAMRPGDVITMYDGQTVEVLNTDAEGRLILADAVAYAQELKPVFTVDIATLTGAVIIALGNRFTGCFCNDESLQKKLNSAAVESAEHIWRLPLHKSFTEEMKGTLADWRNLASRKGSASLGAAFIGAFIKGPWAHLDIGGSVMSEKGNSYLAAGPSGTGVRLLTRLVINEG